MARVGYTNNGRTTAYIGNVRIPAGETRLVDESLVAPPKPAPSAEPDSGDVLDLLDADVASITAAFPELTTAQLHDLAVAEERGKTRKTLMSALSAEILRRTDESEEGEGEGAGEEGEGEGAGEEATE